MKVRGKYSLQVLRKGDRIHSESGSNLVVDTGDNLVATIFKDTVEVARLSHAALGDDGTAPTKGQTALQNEIAASRVAKTGTTQVDNILTYAFQWTVPAGGWIVGEVGLFTAAAAGIMISRFLPQTLNLAENDVLDLSWALTFGGE